MNAMSNKWVVRLGTKNGKGMFLWRIRRTAPDTTDLDGTANIHATTLWADTNPMLFGSEAEANQMVTALTQSQRPPTVCHAETKPGPVTYGRMRIFIGDVELGEVSNVQLK